MTPPATTTPSQGTQPRTGPELPQFSVLGVRIHNVTRPQAIGLLEEVIRYRERRAKSVFFVNAHTLNLAAADPPYRDALNSGDFVFADGTGVRWAARLQGVRVAENLVGTDFVPVMFRETAGRGYSYFMLGSDEATVAVAADYARRTFPGWTLAGCHHGYLSDDGPAESDNADPTNSRRPTAAGRIAATAAIQQVNAARPDVLLVGMGNPLQEQWIRRHLAELEVPLCLGIGGLFDYWAGNVSRAPRWLRRLGHEWLWRLFQQPRLKARRYLIGNPLFLARVLRERLGK
jgi:N-acetylglucosaminyldiphosphoundecaprenol N-acetyl-beta-D-mannosaminyltransferase